MYQSDYPWVREEVTTRAQQDGEGVEILSLKYLEDQK